MSNSNPGRQDRKVIETKTFKNKLLRIKYICSDSLEYQYIISLLAQRFIPTKYPMKVVKQNIQKILNLNWHRLI